MDIAIERLESLRVVDVMTRKVFCLRSDETLLQASKRILETGVASAPVVDEKGVCVGMVGLRILLREITEGFTVVPWSSASNGTVSKQDGEPLPSSPATDRRVRDVMSHGVQSIAPETGILATARIMCLQHAHRLVVLNSQGAPIGMVSSMDIVSTLINVMDEMQPK